MKVAVSPGMAFMLFHPHALFIAPGAGINGGGPILSFSGDAEDIDNDGEDDPAVDLFAQAAQTIADAEATGEGEDDDDEDAEPEDDFNAAWEVLDLARAIYDKQKDENEDDEVKLKLADTYIALGDVSLETGTILPITICSNTDLVVL